MIIFIADDPINNSYVTSLIEAYKNLDNSVICGVRNFYLTNLIPDILHIQWPEKLYNIYPFSSLPAEEKLDRAEQRLKWFKSNGTVIVHTIHNIKPHRFVREEFEKKFFELIISYSDILVHHCNKSVEILSDVYPDTRNKFNLVNHHPDYLVDYKKIEKDEARKHLGLPLSNFIILNFGSQQKYKGERFIESVFKKVPLKDKFLFTAGGFIYEGYPKASSLKFKIRNRVREKIKFKNRKYHYKKINPADLPLYINSADILFLGHQSGLNSGILPLAATYAKPVIFPDIGCFTEQMSYWVFENYKAGDETGATDAIMKLSNKIKSSYKDFDNSKWLEENSWEKHVMKISMFVEEIRIKKSEVRSQKFEAKG